MSKSTTHRDAIMATMILLSGDRYIDPETITVACFKAFPSLFSMDLFKEYPRMDRITKRISDLVSENYLSEKNEGYAVTEKGKEWGEKNSELVRRAGQLLSETEMNIINFQNVGAEEFEKEKKKLIRTSAYNKFKTNKNTITIMDFMDFLKLDIYSTKQLFERKIKRIEAICNMDEELKRLFLFMSEHFGKDYTSFKSELDKLMVEK